MEQFGTSRDLTGGVLSGGLSTRMGQPKDRMLYKGRPMAAYVIETLLKVVPAVVIAGPELDLPEELKQKVQFVADNYPGSGPLGGIEAILSTQISRRFFIASCDQPNITCSLLEALLASSSSNGAFYRGEFIEPLPGIYLQEWLPDVRQALSTGHFALHKFILSKNANFIPLQDETCRLIKSVNSLKDLG